MQDATILHTGCEPTCIAIGKCNNNYKLVSYVNSNNYAFTARQNEIASECNAKRLLFKRIDFAWETNLTLNANPGPITLTRAWHSTLAGKCKNQKSTFSWLSPLLLTFSLWLVKVHRSSPKTNFSVQSDRKWLSYSWHFFLTGCLFIMQAIRWRRYCKKRQVNVEKKDLYH